jgi:VWFA-related protein
MKMSLRIRATLIAAFAMSTFAALGAQQQPPINAQGPVDDRFKFKSRVDLVNVTATVSDGNGRFVSGLQQDDFRVYEDDQLRTITHFNADRVPVSLGIVLDTSSSMSGAKIDAARRSLEEFLAYLTDPEDEFFLYRFSDDPVLLQGWTSDRRAMTRALGKANTKGGTAMYDAVAEALPLAMQGKNRKKAIVIISDGNDTSSFTGVGALRQLIRESEVLVYAIGIDSRASADMWEGRRAPLIPDSQGNPLAPPPAAPIPVPEPFPQPGRPNQPRQPYLPFQLAQFQWPGPRIPGPPRPQPPTRNPLPPPTRSGGADDPVNVNALRDITDDSGGRTEIVRAAGNLAQATANIADELSKQYLLGYPAGDNRDGRWHAIRVEVKQGSYRVRARRGYVAS